jgi:radical SAM superfamily enzyme YgiQ (UPF0313 family)
MCSQKKKYKKVLLVNPIYMDRVLMSQLPLSVGLIYIGTVLKHNGIDVKIVDYFRDNTEISRYLQEYQVVGITATIGTIGEAIRLAKLIREKFPHIIIIFGGPHPTAIYHKLIPRYADIVILGEGEETIIDIFRKSDLSDIKGVAYWDDGIKINKPRPLIYDLDSIPYPDWDLLGDQKHKFFNKKRMVVPLISSRGCPFNCIFCTKFIHGSAIRLRSVDNVLGEIEYLYKKFKIKEIHIVDDNFSFYPERVKAICQEIIKLSYKDLRFSLVNSIRADIGDEEMFKLMSKAGFYYTGFGIESGSQEILYKIGKQLDLKRVYKSIMMARKYNIEVGVTFMIGLPFDTLETIQETIDFAKSLYADHVFFWVATPFPGTEFYHLVEREGKFLYDASFMSHAYTKNRAIYEMPTLKARDVEKMVKKAYQEVYLRPSQLWRQIHRKIKHPKQIWYLLSQGWKTLWYGDWR